MLCTTPVAHRASSCRPADTTVLYETAEGQTIRVGVYARGFQNPWSMAFVSDDTILVAERGGAIKAVRNGVVDPMPVPARRWPSRRAVRHGPGRCTRTSNANRAVYISYTKPLEPAPAPPASGGPPAGAAQPPAGAGSRTRRRGAAPRTAVAVAGRHGTAKASPAQGHLRR